MKKLLDELEKLKGQGYGVNGISRDAAIEDCINIVREYGLQYEVFEAGYAVGFFAKEVDTNTITNEYKQYADRQQIIGVNNEKIA